MLYIGNMNSTPSLPKPVKSSPLKKLSEHKKLIRKPLHLQLALNEIQVYDSESDTDSQQVTMNKIAKKVGKYSLRSQWKNKQFQQLETTSKRLCLGCGNPKCDRRPTCRARGRFCNICGRKKHFSTACLTHHKDMFTLTVIGATSVKDTQRKNQITPISHLKDTRSAPWLTQVRKLI